MPNKTKKQKEEKYKKKRPSKGVRKHIRRKKSEEGKTTVDQK